MQACNVDTYHGGLMCCKHSWFLTDRDQDHLIPKDQVDTYYLKWRYYFQEYKPASNRSPASHKHLHHWVFLIDAQGSRNRLPFQLLSCHKKGLEDKLLFRLG